MKLSITLEFLDIRSFLAFIVKTSCSQQFFKERFPDFVVSVASRRTDFALMTHAQFDVRQVIIVNRSAVATF